MPGEFTIDGDNGDYLVMTNPFGERSFTWFRLIPFVRWIYFQVSGTAAHLVLASRYRDTLDVYNIYIGAQRNTECSLWKGATLLQRQVEPNVLSLEDSRYFWLSWNDGRIQLATGRHRNMGLHLVNYVDPQPLPVTALALTGDQGVVAVWRLIETFSLEMTINTNGRQFYDHAWRSVTHRTDLLFTLQTCGVGEIVLSVIMHELTSPERFYTVVVNSDNNRTEIWRGSNATLLASAPTPLHRLCEVEHHYWLSWFEGHIALGRGQERGQRTIVAYQDLGALPISAIAFGTRNDTGVWRTPLTLDNYLGIPTPRNPNAMSAGSIVGAVFGVIIIVVVFGAIFLYVLAPATFGSLVSRARARLPGGAGTEEASKRVENPVATSMDFAEVRLS